MLRTSRNIKQIQFIYGVFIKRNVHQEKLCVGSKLSTSRTFTQDEVKVFAKMVGDINPIHLDKDYASKTSFKKPIVHGVLTTGLLLISNILVLSEKQKKIVT